MLEYNHLLGREFVYGSTDCLAVLRDFYSENFGLEFPNFARPVEFWKEPAINLYPKLVHKVGFRILECHPTFYRPADLILMAFRSSVPNHAAVFVENGKILHHFIGARSTVEPYSGMWRNATLGVYRHQGINYQPIRTVVQLKDVPIGPSAVS